MRIYSIDRSALQKSRHPIKSIAAHLGFADEKYFANVFKFKTGLTPSQYRRSRTNIDI
ncbi:MAG: AraC family transcriptional regulator [Oscillospiraceae bacterium]|nr:AraC family transcriptional regulator [Oscillospiraceae bacterium]